MGRRDLAQAASRRRPFTILDAMVLVAVAALGVYSIRSNLEYALGTYTVPFLLARVASTYLWIVFPALEILTMSVAVLGLMHRPRSFRRLTCQPGFVAGAAAVMIVGVGALTNLGYLAAWYRFGPGPPPWWRGGSWAPDLMYFNNRMSQISSATLVAWTLMAVGGRWRPVPDWLDRLGRVMGAMWIAFIPLYPFLSD